MTKDQTAQIIDSLADLSARLDSMQAENAKNITPTGKLRNQSTGIKDRRSEDLLRTNQQELEKTQHDLTTSSKRFQNMRPFAIALQTGQIDFDIRVDEATSVALSHVSTIKKHIDKTPSKGRAREIQRIILVGALAACFIIAIIALTQQQVLTPVESWLSPPPNQLCQYQAQQQGSGITNSTLAQQRINTALDSCVSAAQLGGTEHQAAVGLTIIVLAIIGVYAFRKWRK